MPISLQLVQSQLVPRSQIQYRISVPSLFARNRIAVQPAPSPFHFHCKLQFLSNTSYTIPRELSQMFSLLSLSRMNRLPFEWNGSPIKMPKADRTKLQEQQNRPWWTRFVCCKQKYISQCDLDDDIARKIVK